MELTKEYFDETIAGLASKKDLADLAHSFELKQVRGRLEDVEETLDTHTTVLDAIAKDTDDWRTDHAALIRRLAEHYGRRSDT